MGKYLKLLSGILASILIFTNAMPVFASSSEINGLYSKIADINTISLNDNEEMLSLEKERELLEIAREFNLSQQDIYDLREMYNQNSDVITPRARISAVLKIVKSAKPVLNKATKIFGVKLKEKAISDFTDFLFEWQDSLQNGIEYFLANKLGWNSSAAHWAAKTIMFVAF